MASAGARAGRAADGAAQHHVLKVNVLRVAVFVPTRAICRRRAS
ncbi:hypothetical protein [Nonomuraea sp. NPDC049695]